MQDDEQIWLNQARSGDKKAFDLLILRYRPRISHLIQRYLHVDSVDDVCQEIFLRAYRSLHLFRGDSEFYTWLFRIAVNAAKYYRSHELRYAEKTISIDLSMSELANKHLQDFATPENLLAREEMEKRLTIILETLPIPLRMALILREVDGLSYEEIAEVQHCKIGTVRSRLSRARAFLTGQLKALMVNGTAY